MVLLKGKLIDQDSVPFTDAHIKVLNTNIVAVTNAQGYFECRVPKGRNIIIEISHVEINGTELQQVPAFISDMSAPLQIVLQRGIHLAPIDFEVTRGRKGNTFIVMTPENLKIPNPSGDISTFLKSLAGVNSNNELSTQYSVRGGNYDENLVYINGIEIYRPFLNRSGQAEGMSIVNSNMVSTLAFSAGGFSAYYGDKLSSVLDITYKRPRESGAYFEGSLLGGAAHVEGITPNYRLSYMFSTRYRSNKYLLNSLPVQGNYNPTFKDFQSFLSYRLGIKTTLNLLTYYGDNRYLNRPVSQTTKFGTIKDAKQINVYYDGQELIQYKMVLNALQLEMVPNDSMRLQFSSTVYRTDESEQFDVLGQYYLSQLDNELGSETFGDPKYLLGVGSYLNHARNFLLATIGNVQHRGEVIKKYHHIQWGGVYQRLFVNDRLKEWRYLDSADYSVPRNKNLDLLELVDSKLGLQTNKTSAYVLDDIVLNRDLNAKLNVGLRGNYLDYNHQFLVAPRLAFSIEPNRRHNAKALQAGQNDSLKRNIRLKAALGIYQQPPFYRELRTKSGYLVPNVKAQQSMHAVLGADWNFELWHRKEPFKFSSEFYYKYMWDLIPYEIENVRIRYLPEYTAVGYAVGADFHVGGEFIPDLPSWFSFSLMSTRSNIKGDTYVDTNGVTQQIGWLPRPTDQRYAVNVLFQDFLTQNKNYRVHLNLTFAHGLPYGPPGFPQWRSALRARPYRRVDIGFSKVLYNRDEKMSASKILNKTRNISLNVEIFNLFGIRNTISYLWIKDFNNQQYAVPNYLTSRRFNLKIMVRI
ncbi:TonB-dependent receptor plug domain-containing protein [bacterium]|nr:TonB-dependent receptor plug domain-containing protein [bacterium]